MVEKKPTEIAIKEPIILGTGDIEQELNILLFGWF